MSFNIKTHVVPNQLITTLLGGEGRLGKGPVCSDLVVFIVPAFPWDRAGFVLFL